MSTSRSDLATLQARIWNGSLPVEIRLSPLDCRTYDKSIPYLVQVPRISYLPFLLAKLHAFFQPSLVDPNVLQSQGWFSFEEVPLRWQHPVGLLYDLFSGAEPSDGHREREHTVSSHLPWKLKLHYSDWPSDLLIPLDEQGKIHNDNFINSVKEADFLRNGTGRVMMSLSKDDSTKLWTSIQAHDLQAYNSVNTKFLNLPGGASLRNAPIKIYLPHAEEPEGNDQKPPVASLRVVQSLVPLMATSKEPRTLGVALNEMLPTLFPSRRSFIHGRAVLHGAVVPPNAPLLDLIHSSTYADGFLHVAVSMGV